MIKVCPPLLAYAFIQKQTSGNIALFQGQNLYGETVDFMSFLHKFCCYQILQITAIITLLFQSFLGRLYIINA